MRLSIIERCNLKTKNAKLGKQSTGVRTKHHGIWTNSYICLHTHARVLRLRYEVRYFPHEPFERVSEL